MSWKTETFGSLLTESRIPCENPNIKKRIRVKLHVQGVEKRPVGAEKVGATKQFIRKAGQFIYGKQNFHKGAFGVIPEILDGFETSADIPSFDVREDCLPEWIYYFFKAGNRYLELTEYARGIGSQRIHPKQLAELEIPLPPLDIQQKIIAELEIIENDEISTELTHQLDLVKQLRKAFLQEAMQGKLVPQDPNDEPASVLLEKIRAEKERLTQEKKIKKQKPLSHITEAEIPFEIPEGWVWCRLGECISLKSGQDLKPNQYSNTNKKGIPYITGASNLKDEKVIINRWTSDPKSIAVKGELLLTCKGSGLGKMAWLKDDSVHIARQIMAINTYIIKLEYIKVILDQNVANYKNIAKSLIPGIDRETVLLTNLPLPPLKEQERIVAKMDELMVYCDELESSIKESQQQNELLLQQVLSEVLS